MARNRFDVDETLETPFNIKHLLRAGVYIKRHKQKMILSLVFSAISAACALVGPKLIETALNVAVPNRDYKMLFILAGIMLLSILLSIFFSVKRSRYMTVVGQAIIYDIRKDLFEHLQRLSFQFYDDRPHGKILTRVINYVNSVSDALSNASSISFSKFSTSFSSPCSCSCAMSGSRSSSWRAFRCSSSLCSSSSLHSAALGRMFPIRAPTSTPTCTRALTV